MKLHAVVPVYNVEPYISKFLDSIICQDSDAVNYILVNDGSTDRSGEICDSYAGKDSRLKVIHTTNGGVSRARNTALDFISNNSEPDDYVIFFDPDDYLTSPHAISDIKTEIEKSHPDLLLYNYMVNNTLIHSVLQIGGYSGQEIGQQLYPWVLLGVKKNGVILSASLFRGAFSINIINNFRLRFREDIRKSEDILFYAKFLTLIEKVSLSTVTPYNYNIRPGSLTTTYRMPSMLGIEKGLSILSDFLQYAQECPGIDKKEVDNYFKGRYIGLVINFVIGLTDSRSGLSTPQINSQLNELYAVEELSRKLKDIGAFDGLKKKKKIEGIMVKHRFGLVFYGRLFHFTKKLRNKIIHRC